ARPAGVVPAARRPDAAHRPGRRVPRRGDGRRAHAPARPPPAAARRLLDGDRVGDRGRGAPGLRRGADAGVAGAPPGRARRPAAGRARPGLIPGPAPAHPVTSRELRMYSMLSTVEKQVSRVPLMVTDDDTMPAATARAGSTGR